MTWLPNSQELVFAAGSTIVIMQSKFSIQEQNRRKTPQQNIRMPEERYHSRKFYSIVRPRIEGVWATLPDCLSQCMA